MMTPPTPPPLEETRALLDDECDNEDASSSDDFRPNLDSIERVGPKDLVVEQDDFEASDFPVEEQPAGPNQFVDSYETSNWEIWSYYLCYAGNTGLASFYFAPTAFQNLLSQAAGDEGIMYFAGR